MVHRRPVFAAGVALLFALGAPFVVLSGGAAYAATTSLCQEQTASVAGGSYIVQNNEYDSSAPRVRHDRRQRRLHGGQLVDRQRHQRLSRRVPVDLPGLPLGRLQLRRPQL